MICNGSAVSRATYSDLYNVITSTYGNGNGVTTFNLPNLTGRIAVGQDPAGSVLSSSRPSVGGTGGVETHTLSLNELASHSHGFTTYSAGDHSHTTVSAGAHNHTGLATGGEHKHVGEIKRVYDINTGEVLSENVSDPFQTMFPEYNFSPYNVYTHQRSSHTHKIDVTSSQGQGGDPIKQIYEPSSSIYDVKRDKVFLKGGSHKHSTVETYYEGWAGYNIDASNSSSFHSHTFPYVFESGAHSHAMSSAGEHFHTGTTNPTAPGGAHNNMQPYLTVNYIIKY